MKVVKSKEEVHIRSKEPYRRTWNKKGVLNPGFEVEVVLEKPGEEINGNNIWYQDRNGDYYWSGGFAVETPESKDKASRTKWNQVLQGIPEPWIKNGGKGVKVAVLDSGVFPHEDIGLNLSNLQEDFSLSTNGYIDIFGHGTRCAGLIAAMDRPTGLTGVAAQAICVNLKVRNDEFGTIEPVSVNKAILRAIELKIPVISMSFDLPFNSDTANLIDQHSDKHVFVCAAGDNERLLGPNIDFPANHKKSLSIGAVSQNFLTQNTAPFAQHLDFLAPFIELESTDIPAKGGYSKDSGSSFSTAILSGIVALILKKFAPGAGITEFVKGKLNDTSLPTSSIRFTTKPYTPIIKVPR